MGRDGVKPAGDDILCAAAAGSVLLLVDGEVLLVGGPAAIPPEVEVSIQAVLEQQVPLGGPSPRTRRGRTSLVCRPAGGHHP